MKKIRLVLVICLIIVLFGSLFWILKNNFGKQKNSQKNILIEKVLKSSGEYFEPEYNKEYITKINEIKLENKDIKNKYQFVYISDLQASMVDGNEEEQIRNSLEQRYNDFVSQNPNQVRSKRNI